MGSHNCNVDSALLEITQKFVEKYFSDDFQCLYATHDNTEHVHSHILFNSQYVKIFSANGLNVIHGHIQTGQDFFKVPVPEFEYLFEKI